MLQTADPIHVIISNSRQALILIKYSKVSRIFQKKQ